MVTPTEPAVPPIRHPLASATPIAPTERRSLPAAANALAALLGDVVRARALLAQQRRMPQSKLEPGGMARAEMLSALEAYTAALDARRLPVPYALRDELRIQQRVRR